MPPERVAEISARRSEGRLLVWPENRRAVELFLAAGTAWRWQVLVGPSGKTRTLWQGLDWPAVQAVAAMGGYAIDRPVLADLRDLEGAALEALNRR